MTPPDFDGANDRLANALTLNNFFSTTAWFMAGVFQADTAQAYGSDEYDNECIVAAQGAAAATIGIAFSANGVSAFHISGGAWPGVTVACGTGAYHAFFAWYDGININLQIDSGAPSSAAAGSIDSLATETLVVGVDWNAAQFFDGRLLELMIASTNISANVSNIKSYFNSRYALSL